MVQVTLARNSFLSPTDRRRDRFPPLSAVLTGYGQAGGRRHSRPAAFSAR